MKWSYVARIVKREAVTHDLIADKPVMWETTNLVMFRQWSFMLWKKQLSAEVQERVEAENYYRALEASKSLTWWTQLTYIEQKFYWQQSLDLMPKTTYPFSVIESRAIIIRLYREHGKKPRIARRIEE